jgi:hypothetical protein
MAKRICSVGDCDRPVKALGYCGSHYKRWLLHGDVQADKPLERSKSICSVLRKACRKVRHDKKHDLVYMYTSILDALTRGRLKPELPLSRCCRESKGEGRYRVCSRVDCNTVASRRIEVTRHCESA